MELSEKELIQTSSKGNLLKRGAAIVLIAVTLVGSAIIPMQSVSGDQDVSSVATTTVWYSSSWWNGFTRRNELTTTRGGTSTNNPLWTSQVYHVNRTSNNFNVSYSRTMTRSGTVSLGAGVSVHAITANSGGSVTFSNSVTVGGSNIVVRANRRVTMQTRTSAQSQTFNTRIQEQTQGLFQSGQWTNSGSPVTRTSTTTTNVPGFRAIETAVNTAAPR